MVTNDSPPSIVEVRLGIRFLRQYDITYDIEYNKIWNARPWSYFPRGFGRGFYFFVYFLLAATSWRLLVTMVKILQGPQGLTFDGVLQYNGILLSLFYSEYCIISKNREFWFLLPPASAVEVIESVTSVCVSYLHCVGTYIVYQCSGICILSMGLLSL